MNEYKGAVLFLDILGIGALTQETIKLTKNDFYAHKFKMTNKSPHSFCAQLLMKFRKILSKIKKQYSSINVAQLSDSAFIWSADVHSIVEVARFFMWEAINEGILCRGGMAYGEIVEPNKTNVNLGQFICGKAATNAVKLESSGKGARIFIDTEIPSKLSPKAKDTLLFRESVKPTDCTYIDEFIWWYYSDPESHYQILQMDLDKQVNASAKIMKIIALLLHSPKFRWNASTKEGLTQIAVTIDRFSDSISKLFDLPYIGFTADHIINYREDNGRSDELVKKRSLTFFDDVEDELLNSKLRSFYRRPIDILATDGSNL